MLAFISIYMKFTSLDFDSSRIKNIYAKRASQFKAKANNLCERVKKLNKKSGTEGPESLITEHHYSH